VSCKQSNELSGAVKGGQFICYLCNHHVIKNKSAPWSLSLVTLVVTAVVVTNTMIVVVVVVVVIIIIIIMLHSKPQLYCTA
jgi:hypothetical protein